MNLKYFITLIKPNFVLFNVCFHGKSKNTTVIFTELFCHIWSKVQFIIYFKKFLANFTAILLQELAEEFLIDQFFKKRWYKNDCFSVLWITPESCYWRIL